MSQFNYQILGTNPMYITIVKDNNSSQVYFADHGSYTLNTGVNLFENNVTIEEQNGTFIVKHAGQQLEPVKILATTAGGSNSWLLLFLVLIVILLLLVYFYLNRSRA